MSQPDADPCRHAEPPGQGKIATLGITGFLQNSSHQRKPANQMVLPSNSSNCAFIWWLDISVAIRKAFRIER
jgi:hypothetical protein